MAVAWKKVYTEGDDIAITDGGTGNSDAWTNGAAVGNATANALDIVTMAENYLLMGGTNAVGIPVAQTPQYGSSQGDIALTGGSTGNMFLTVQALKIDNSKVANATLVWSDNYQESASGAEGTNDSAGDGKMATNTDLANGIAAYDENGVPEVLVATNSGDALIYNGTKLVWDGSETNAGTIDIAENGNAIAYPMVFAQVSGASGELALDTPDVANGGVTYNPSTNGMIVGLAADPGSITCAEFFGRADEAIDVLVEGDATSNVDMAVMFANVGGGGDGYQRLNQDYHDLTYNPSTATLTVPNLTVTGTNTIIHTTEMTVEDANITIAITDGTQVDSAASSLNPGIEVFLTEAGNSNALVQAALPKLRYAGQHDTSTPTGWMVAKYGTDSTAVTAGVAGMNVSLSGLVTTTTLNGGTPDFDIGIGAFCYTNALTGGGLFIQVAV